MIELQPFTREGFNRLLDWIKSPEDLLQWAGPAYTYPLDIEQLEANFQQTLGESPSRLIFKALDAETGTVIGHAEMGSIDRRNRSTRISRVLVGDPTYRGKGAGTQIVRKTLEIAFDEMRLHRVDLAVFDFNTPAIRLYQRLGFVEEGRLRDSRVMGDEFWSIYVMSLLEDEWRALKARG